ncbi:MAG: NAD(P)/FAD-dependent oxidoreductase, partial [Rhizobiaceae bacterium]
AYGWSVRKSHGFNWDILEGEEFKQYEPVFSPELGCAVRLKDHGILSDPGRYVKDLAAHVEATGGKVLKGEVTDIAVESGNVTGVRVGGEKIDCDSAIIAAGIWSTDLARQLGLKVPMESERGYHLELWEPNFMPKMPAMVASGKFVITPMDGRLRLAGVVEFGGVDAPPSKAPIELLKKNAEAALPGISWKKTSEWMGHRPSIVDSIPVIGEVPSVSGAFVGFGHDHIGLTGGPKTGRILSQLVSGKRPNLDLAFYSPSRFQ